MSKIPKLTTDTKVRRLWQQAVDIGALYSGNERMCVAASVIVDICGELIAHRRKQAVAKRKEQG